MVGMAWVVAKVSEAYAHVVADVPRDGHCEADSEDGVGDSEDVEIAITKEEQAGGESPERGCYGEHGIGEVGDGEEADSSDDGAPLGWQEAKEAEEDEVLKEKLLYEGPDCISPEGF
jgi:hypothetical protein